MVDYASHLDRVLGHLAAAQAHQAVVAQRLVVPEAHPTGRELVGGDVVDELARGVEAHMGLALWQRYLRVLHAG